MRRFLSIRVLLPAVTSLMTLVLVVIFALYGFQARQRESAAQKIPLVVDASYDLFEAIQAIRLERGAVNTVLPEVADASALKEIAQLRARSGMAIDSALRKLAALDAPGIESDIARLNDARTALIRMRAEVDPLLPQPHENYVEIRKRWISTVDPVVDAIDGLSFRLENTLSEADSFVAQMIRMKQLVWPVRSDSGNDRLLLRAAMESDKSLGAEDRHQLDLMAGRIEGGWKRVLEQASRPDTPPALQASVDAADGLYFKEFFALRNHIIDELAAGRPVKIDSKRWLKLTADSRESIYEVARTALGLASEHAAQQAAAAERTFYASIGLMILFFGIGTATSLYVIRGVVSPITEVADVMRTIANGNLHCAIPYESRSDEIGLLARGLRIFRDNAIEKQKLHLEKVGAEAANRTKSEFLANMSHELRTPLNAIIGFSDVIKTAMFGPLQERYRDYATDIFNSGSHLLKLINEILDLTKLEAKQFELHEEELDIASVVASAIHVMESHAEAARVRLVQVVEPHLPMIRADDRRLRQILFNLLSNALKFTPEGGRVQVAARITEHGVLVSVKDNGIGMSADQIPTALEPFRQIDSKMSRKYEGTGLGLPLTKHLVELHGGTLNVESAPNTGTTVTFTIPHERVVQAGKAQPVVAVG
jgi:signal transduction histidine kinase